MYPSDFHALGSDLGTWYYHYFIAEGPALSYGDVKGGGTSLARGQWKQAAIRENSQIAEVGFSALAPPNETSRMRTRN